LNTYATERQLFRLGNSEFATRFVLKGARLFALWSATPQRPTRDLDLLGLGDSSSELLQRVFQSICRAEVEPDGLTFDDGSVSVEEIRLEKEYDGQRVKLTAHLAQARIPLQIDAGFGDIIAPDAQLLDYTPLLGKLPAPQILAYPRETVIAEILQAIISLVTLNTRMKDFYDLGVLAAEFDYDGRTLCRAIKATFERRRTPIPTEIPSCLSPAFAEDDDRKQLWKGFLKRSAIDDRTFGDFAVVLANVRDFLAKPLLAANQHATDFAMKLRADPGWHRE